MAKCFNKNTTEYKALKEVYGNNLIVDSIIDRFQKSAKTDIIPSTEEASDLINDTQVLYSLDKNKFGDALLNNLSRNGIITNHQGEFFVVHGNQETRAHDPIVLEHNLNRLTKYLLHNNISADTVNLQRIRSKKTYRVTVNNNMFTTQDIIEERNNKDKTYIYEYNNIIIYQYNQTIVHTYNQTI